MAQHEIVFTVKVGQGQDAQERSVTARKPTLLEHKQAKKVYNLAFKDAVVAGVILRTALEDFARSQGVWDDEKQEKAMVLTRNIDDAEKALKKGGIKLSRAKEIAMQLNEHRMDLLELLARKNQLDENTAEAQAETERFNYFVSVCLVYNDTKQPVFKDVADYLNNANELYAIECATKLSKLLYNIKDDYFETLPERLFLEKFGFMDKEGYLLDDKGRRTNRAGHLVDDKGRLINESGERVDEDGNVLGDDPDAFTPFLDENDAPIEEKVVQEPDLAPKVTDETETE